MKKHLYTSVIAICAFQIAFVGHALPQNYAFQNFTVEDGLAQSEILSILRDRRGYLWFATWHGVSRFDGHTFSNYSSDDGLPENGIMTILEDKQGNLWFGSWGGGVSRFDGKEWKTFTKEDGLAEDIVNAIFEDREGNIWFGTENCGVSKFDGERWETFTIDDGLGSNLVSSIIEDSQGNYWFGTSFGISRFDGKEWTNFTFEKVRLDQWNKEVLVRPQDRLDHDIVQATLLDSKGNIWVGTPEGVNKFDGKQWFSYTTEDGLIDNFINCVFEDREGNFWFGSRGGVNKFDGETWKSFTKDNGLVSNIVTAIIEDNEGNLWFGTESGVSKLGGTAFVNFTESNGLVNDHVLSVYEDTKENLWIGTNGSGISIFDGNEWNTITVENGLVNNIVQAILEDSEGNIWVGTHGGGVSQFDGEKWVSYTKKDSSIFNGQEWVNILVKDWLVNNYIYTICEDSQGNIWFGTVKGVSRFDGKNWKSFTDEDGLSHNTVHKILEDRKGTLWFATYGGGASRFDGKNWSYLSTDDGLVSNYLNTIFEDNEGNLWFGSDSKGISKFDGNSFVNYTIENGLSDNNCCGITQDDNYIYFGMINGVNRFDGKTFKVFTNADGLFGHEMCRGACLKGRQGYLWFGTSNGLSRYDPSINRPELPPPPIFITKVTTIDNRTISDGSKLNHSTNYLKFIYTGLTFTSPETMIYQYKLEGVDNNWQESNLSTVQYTSLPNGSYTFKVRARNIDEVWSKSSAEFRFRIQPPFWATWWFRILTLISTVGLLCLIFWTWHKYESSMELNEKNILLEKEINDRKKIEANLDEWKKRYETAVISSGHILYDWDSVTNEVIYGGDFFNLLGYTAEEMKGGLAGWVELIHPEDKDNFQTTIKKLLNTKEPAHLEYRIRKKDGSYINIEDTGRFIEDSDGNLKRMIGFIKDVSHNKQLEEERAKAAKLESIGILAGGIAHDFNNILSAILGNVNLANKIMTENKSLASESLTAAEAACGRAKELTYQLLTFSKGGAPVKKATLLSGLIKESAEFALRGSNVKYKHYISEKLWPCEIDEGQISQVINNIIINADHAMPEGGTISVRAKNVTVDKNDRLPLKEGKYVKLSIVDQGLGISKKNLLNIFDPYFSTKQNGSGLGLTTSYSIIKRHDGYIKVESELNAGTTVHLYLPASSEQVEEKETKKEDKTFSGAKILVMDDDQMICDIVTKMLVQMGHEVACVKDGTQAVKIYKQAKDTGRPFNAVILDLTIPGGTGGKATLDKLLEIDPMVKAIASSGYSNDPLMANFRDHKFSSALSKPYRLDELRNALLDVLRD